MFSKVVLDWLTQSKLTDWVQAIGSIAAVVVASFAFRTAKLSLHAPYRTKVNLHNYHYQSTSATTFVITLDNVGPGIAYRVEVQGMVLDGVAQTSIFYYYATASGHSEIHPQTKESYAFNKMINLNYPILLKYETLTGIKVKEFWKCRRDKNGIRFYEQLNLIQILKNKYLYRETFGDKKIKRRILKKPPED